MIHNSTWLIESHTAEEEVWHKGSTTTLIPFEVEVVVFIAFYLNSRNARGFIG